MAELFAIAFLGGLITGVSPCIVPVLPVVMAGGSTGTNRARPFLIIGGLVLSFSLTELIGSTVLSAIGLPQNFLYWFGIALLLILAIGLVVPLIGEWIERPFSRLGSSRYATSGGGFLLGFSLGFVFVPCAGPVLAAISVASANHRVTASSFFVTIFYTIGATLPLMVFAGVAEQRATLQWQRLRTHLPMVRRISGAVLGVTALLIAFGVFDPLQRAVPGYTSALENHVEGSASITKQLQNISGEHANTFAKAPTPASPTAPAALPKLGPAPQFTGIVSWLNTPSGAPLTLAKLHGKVVLIDFWTYTCINCQRSLPHVEAWYKDYKSDGFVVVGVHTPEFAFEHVVSNVRTAAATLGVHYPIAVDSNYGTWDAYGNQYWPAEYLIDPNGQVRAVDFGEGEYSTMESNIRNLLVHNGVQHLPSRTDVADRTPQDQITPESYLGYEQIAGDVGTSVVNNKTVNFHAPSSIATNSFAFNGLWDDHQQEASAVKNAQIHFHISANDVYLVIGGKGTVDISFNGKHTKTVQINGIPKLYTMLSGKQLQTGELTMSFTAGLQAYDFTFG